MSPRMFLQVVALIVIGGFVYWCVIQALNWQQRAEVRQEINRIRAEDRPSPRGMDANTFYDVNGRPVAHDPGPDLIENTADDPHR